MRLKEILSLEPFAEACVVAGENGLEHNVNRVSLIEVPESKNWFKKNELYITSFYSIRNNIHLQKETLKKINKCGAAGIVYIDLYIYDLEKEIINYANENNITIIRIPYAVSYSSMISAIMRKLIKDKDGKIYKSNNMKNNMVRLFNAKSTSEIINLLDEICENPVLYYKKDNVFASKRAKKLSDKIIKKIINNTKNDMQKDNIKNYNYDIYNIDETAETNQLIILYDKNENFKMRNYYSLRFNDFIMEIGQLLLMYQKYNKKLDNTRQDRLKNKLVNMLINQNITKENFYQLANNLNWGLKSKFLTILLYSEKNDNSEISVNRLNNTIKNIFGNYILDIKLNEKKYLYILSTNYDIEKVEDKILNKIDYINKYSVQLLSTTQKNKKDLIITLGSIVHKIKDIKSSYSYMERTFNFIKNIKENQVLCSWVDISVYELLLKNKNRQKIETFEKNILGELLNNENEIYLDTLIKYFHANEDRKKTSDLMNLHYNTVIYRINKAKSIIGKEIFENKSLIYMALQLNRLINFESD